MNEDQTPVEEVVEETDSLETTEAESEEIAEASAEQQAKLDRQLDFSDVEEDRECPFELEERKRVVEALLFVSDKPIGLSQFVNAFGFDDQENPIVYTREIEEALEDYKLDLEEQNRGFRLHSVSGGYQLRSAEDLKPFLQNTIKARTFRLTGPTLETLAIIAYKQPLTKSQVDDVRGVDSSHLIRGLMDKDLLAFAGKSELPGKPMLYKTTTKFLEIFGLRNLNELPSLSEIEALIPEGIGNEEEEEEQTLSQLTGKLSEEGPDSYSVSEEEHDKIVGELSDISTSTEFFEQEKQRERERKEVEKAEGIREALMVGEAVSDREKRWLERFDEKLKAKEEEANQQEEDASGEEVGLEASVIDAADEEGSETDTFEDFGAEDEGDSLEAAEEGIDESEEFEDSAEEASMEASSLNFEEGDEPEALEEEVSLMDDIAESEDTDVEPLNEL